MRVQPNFLSEDEDDNNDFENPIDREESKPHSKLNILEDPIVFQMYRLSKKQYYNSTSIIPMVIFSCLLFYTFVTRAFDVLFLKDADPLFLVTSIAITIAMVIFVAYFVAHLIIYFTPTEKKIHLIYKVSKAFLYLYFGGRIEDVVCILATIAIGFALFGTVFNGPCKDLLCENDNADTQSWKCQRYNRI